MIESFMTLIQQLDVQDHVIDTEGEGGQQGSVDRTKIHHTMTSEREREAPCRLSHRRAQGDI